MNLEKITTGLRGLAEVIQDILLAVELGQMDKWTELGTQLQVVLGQLKDSNCHIAVHARRCIVRLDGTHAAVRHKLTDYCFADPASEEPRCHCEVSASLVLDGRKGHPIPGKGDIEIDIRRIDTESDDLEASGDSSDDPLTGVKHQEFDRLLKDMGFDAEKKE